MVVTNTITLRPQNAEAKSNVMVVLTLYIHRESDIPQKHYMDFKISPAANNQKLEEPLV